MGHKESNLSKNKTYLIEIIRDYIWTASKKTVLIRLYLPPHPLPPQMAGTIRPPDHFISVYLKMIFLFLNKYKIYAVGAPNERTVSITFKKIIYDLM